MRRLLVWFGFLSVCLAHPGWAADPVDAAELDETKATEAEIEPLEDAPPLVPSQPAPAPKATSGFSLTPNADTNLLEVFLFMDTTFSVGRSLSQGFEISTARFGARGDVAPYVDYRMMAGQTREFSSAQLPQLTVVDAWVRAHGGRKEETNFAWKAGMFTPTVNPWWSPDLADVPFLPDYAENHAAILPNRDIGSEIQFRPFTGAEVVVGIFNGSGITTLNTNNSRGFNGMVRGRLDLDGSFLEVGVGGFLQQQAESGSVNFVNNAAGTFFMSLGSESNRWWVSADVTSGRVEDASRSDAALGASLMTQFEIDRPFSLFARAEILRVTPTSSGNVERVQLGPVFHANQWLRAFALYEYRRNSSGAESAGEVRVRVSL